MLTELIPADVLAKGKKFQTILKEQNLKYFEKYPGKEKYF